MYARNITERNLKDIAHSLKFEVECDKRGNKIKFKLRNNSGRYWKISRNLWGNDRVRSDLVCYHGVYAFLHVLFDIFPDAIVEASWYGYVKYTKDTYIELADAIGDRVIRQYDQLTPRDQCNCEDQDWYNLERSC